MLRNYAPPRRLHKNRESRVGRQLFHLAFLGNSVTSDPHNYRIATIPKGGRGTRKIYIPDEVYKNKLRSFLPALHRIASDLDIHSVCHAFLKGRNCVTNARPHVGFRYSVSLDIEDFFDSIQAESVRGLIPDEIFQYCFIDGAPRQGLPTSPLIANVALSEVDRHIYKSLIFICGSFAYTRYADDLTISFDNRKAIQRVIFLVRDALIKKGFSINEQKTRIQSAYNGRRIITGIGVSEHGLHATRKTLKALRAATHQNNLSSARGLLEWALCKQPGQEKLEFPELYRRRVDGKVVTCEYCLEPGFFWEIQNGDRYILVGSKSGEKHICSSFPLPVSKSDFECELRATGFREMAPSSTTWKLGLWKASSTETLLILFRKHGIDICIYDYAKRFPVGGKSISLGCEGSIFRLSYGNELVNVHAYVLRLASQLRRGERVERNILRKMKGEEWECVNVSSRIDDFSEEIISFNT